MKPEIIVAYLSSGSVFVPLSVALIHWRSLESELKFLRLILLVSLLCDALSLVFVTYSINTHLIGNTYLLLQFSFVYKILTDQLQRRKYLITIYLTFVAFYIANMTFYQGPLKFNSVSNVAASFIIMTLSLQYLYHLMAKLPIMPIHRLPMLWISFAVLSYYAGTFFLFLISNYLVEGAAASHRMIWILHNVLNIIKNLLFAIAIWQSYQTTNSSIS